MMKMSNLDFATLREANTTRKARWHAGADVWSLADWSNAMCGEAGETANVVKKIRRHETGLGTSHNTPELDALRADLADEMADVVAYLDILASEADIDLGAAVQSKFNRISEAAGFPERI